MLHFKSLTNFFFCIFNKRGGGVFFNSAYFNGIMWEDISMLKIMPFF